MYVEREQLQSGADAGAIKLAQVCASSPADCTASAGDLGRYANLNSGDGTSGIGVVCGRGGDLPACPPPSGGVTDCVRAAPAAGEYVEIHTSTRLPDGSTVLPPAFAQAVVDGYRGPTVTACARAAWGAPRNAKLALAISACEWTTSTGNGTSFPDPPVEQVIRLHDDKDAAACGEFGWLDDPKRDCGTPVEANGTYRSGPNGRPSPACEALLTSLRATGRPVLMPVYSAVTKGDGAMRYTLLGFAAFVVTGWDLPGSHASSKLTGKDPCADSEKCITGYFTRATLPGSGATGGPDLGARVVGLVG
jgi:hypothetical protein